uniref:ATP synthase complex subunit 8 n=1 Tax=Paranauphoeta circumdata TaxID=2093442 RepID=A0A2P1H9L6_9NEOP|nr:ATP synthase F0 subunit 8 [Paranauphoeta circumdata]
MPQMMPLAWLTLFIFFIMTLITFSFINYYLFIPIPNTLHKKINFKSLNWKW